MTDQRFTELLSRKLSDEISTDEEQELLLLLAENAQYRQEYESLNEYLQQEEEPDSRIDVVFEKIKAQISSPEPVIVHPSSSPGIVKRSFALWYRIAAIFILGICAFTAYRTFSTKNTFDQTSRIAWKKLVSSPGKVKSKITLADGTQVTLNAESELEYPPAFNRETRDVYLSGEAFFDVAKDHQHPFIVHTEKMSIKVLGTAFDVKSYKNEPLTETTLLRGSIQITLNNQPESQILLKPSEKFSLIHDQKGLSAKDPVYSITAMNYLDTADQNTLVETSWMENKLVFKNENFATLTLDMARWYGVKFIFNTQQLKQEKFTGEFEKESLTDALKALQSITPFDYKIEGKTIYLYTQN